MKLKGSSLYWAFKRFGKLGLFFYVLLILIFSFLNAKAISLLNFLIGGQYWMNISKSSNKAKEKAKGKEKAFDGCKFFLL